MQKSERIERKMMRRVMGDARLWNFPPEPSNLAQKTGWIFPDKHKMAAGYISV